MNIKEIHINVLTEKDKFFYAGEAYVAIGEVKKKGLQYLIPAVQLDYYLFYNEEEVLETGTRIALIHASSSEMLWKIEEDQ